MINIRRLALTITSMLTIGGVQADLLELSKTPLFITSAAKPNVLMILDTSGSMNWSVDGSFVRGDHPDSRSEVARNAAEMVIDSFGDRFNLGLMSYDQKTPKLYSTQVDGVWLNYWGGGHGNGGGRLDAPIAEVDSSHKTALKDLLATEQYVAAVDIPLRNSGGTPIEGSLYSAKDYFEGSLHSNNIVDSIEPLGSLPESCGYDYVVLLTDGEPTTSKDGAGAIKEKAIQDCADAAQALNDAGVTTFVVGFSSGIGAGALDSIASAGGSDTMYDAADEDALELSLRSIFSSISDVKASYSAIAANSGQVTSDALVFQASFDSGTWGGSLTASTIDSSDNISSTPNWDAADQYPSDWTSGRQVLTWDGTAGVPFTAANMTASMQAWLNDDPSTPAVDSDGYYQERISYLRGARADSFSGVSFRSRDKALGDIVHSSPVFVGAPYFSYPDALQSSAYSTFKQNQKSRRPVVYVGANDGMLHAFDASADAEVSGVKKGGTELFSYVPKAVYPHLSNLTNPAYDYQPTVDGSITVGDVFWNGSWKTVLVGALRGGGQGYYALDITDPDTITEANASSKVLWEFTDESNQHMGYSYGSAAIVKMANGKWAAVFGNGYNSSEADGIASSHGKGVLYFVNIKNGNLMRKIVVPSGTVSTPNGLGTPAPVDINGDHVVDYIYAGDLNGNIWKFDVTGATSSSWVIAHSSLGVNFPMFVAQDSSGNPQPITTRPEVVRNPDTNDLLVLFGTGKYLELTDTNPAHVGQHTFYGVKDDATLSTSMLRSDLVEQEVLGTKTLNAGAADEISYRLISDNAIDWVGGDKGWYIDLPDSGEMVISNPVARNDQIVFTTAVPAADLCTVGGAGWFMELKFSSGGRSDDGVIDVDGDLDIDADDYLDFSTASGTVTAPVSGFSNREGFLTSPLILSLSPESIDPENPVEYKFTTGSSATVGRIVEKATLQSSGRLSWRQIH